MAKRADSRERRLELLLGARVYDRAGRAIGRLEEFRARRAGDGWELHEYHIGPAGLLERLSVRHMGWLTGSRPHGYVASWDQVSLEDAERPRLTCDLGELRPVRRVRRQRASRR